jgi:hypothetical protein
MCTRHTNASRYHITTTKARVMAPSVRKKSYLRLQKGMKKGTLLLNIYTSIHVNIADDSRFI